MTILVLNYPKFLAKKICMQIQLGKVLKCIGLHNLASNILGSFMQMKSFYPIGICKEKQEVQISFQKKSHKLTADNIKSKISVKRD